MINVMYVSRTVHVALTHPESSVSPSLRTRPNLSKDHEPLALNIAENLKALKPSCSRREEFSIVLLSTIMS